MVVTVLVGPVSVVVPDANTVVVAVDVDGPFLELRSRSWLSLCSAPANSPIKTAVSRSRSNANMSRILVSVVSGSLRISARRSPKVL